MRLGWKARFFIPSFALLFFGLLASFHMLSGQFESLVSTQGRLVLSEEADRALEGFPRPAKGQKKPSGSPSLAEWARGAAGSVGGDLWVLDDQGSLLAAAPSDAEGFQGDALRLPEVRSAQTRGTGFDQRPDRASGAETLYMAKRATLGSRTVLIRFSVPLSRWDNALGDWRFGIRLAFMALLVAGALMAWVAAVFMARAVEREAAWDQADRASSGKDQRPFSAPGPEDPRAVYVPGRNFNELMGRLDSQDPLLLTVFNSMNEGVLLLNAADRIVLLNPSAEKILGTPEGKALGRHYLEVVRHAGLADLITQSKQGSVGEVAHAELEVPGEEDRTFSVNVGAVRESGGSVLGQIVVFSDITGLKRLMKMRTDFVANVSHELKTPLTAILGYVETLLTGGIDDKKNRAGFLQKIADQSKRLHALIEDVLELSRIEGGRYGAVLQPVEVQAVAEQALDLVRAKAEARGTRFETSLEEGLSVQAHEEGLLRILVNLLDNAVKYSPDKSLVRLMGRRLVGGGVSISVMDEGSGIPTTHLPRIFERFYRAEASRNRQAGGTGLGLSIVKHLTERMEGEVKVESQEGKGSVFTVLLPEARPA